MPLRKIIRQKLRTFLLWALRWTETAQEDTIRTSQLPLLKREIHIPTGLVALLVWVTLFGVLFLDLGPGWVNTLALFLFTAILMSLFLFYIKHDQPALLNDDDGILLLGILAVGSVLFMQGWNEISRTYVWISPYGVPLAATSILAALLLHPRLAIILGIVLALIMGVTNDFSIEYVLVGFLGSVTGVARSLTVRTRRDLSRAGLWVALMQSLMVCILALFQKWLPEEFITAVLWSFGGGILSSLIVLGLLPYLENFFSRLTNIRLLELVDINHPLLRRMSLEVPGTYHHSLVVASLAESAAESIGANGLLCRAGAYFHDIGKMIKPEYFVENQGSLANPHDPLSPSMSRLVIQAHVKEGLALAQQYGLDKSIQGFIQSHHGTSRIEYFYQRALEQEGESAVKEQEYRYPGPKPYTKESAILMLADAVEASSRTQEDPNHQRLRDLVYKIVNSKITDDQFSESPLTLAELHDIAKSFINTLTGIYHSRIRYPDSVEEQELPPGPDA
ncbi:MAG TPA: HDIG domain-containing protein [Elusimicrobiota bacterium]|nr:HDIG domain-containing protein [Elusimicrobiota bacterium]